MLKAVREHLRAEAADLCGSGYVPGYLAGVYHAGEEVMTYEPLDASHARIFNHFSGGQFPMPPWRLVSVGDGLFAPAGVPLATFNGLGRVRLVSFHGETDGRAAYRSFGGRMTRRDAGSAPGETFLL